jgi:CheY-like chemotaxis protein
MLSAVTSMINQLGRRKTVAPHRFRVLIVDDEAGVRRYADRVLRGEGHETFLAADGPQALEVAAMAGHIDLLVTDFMMPGMCGDEVASRLRQNHADLKVLYITGYSNRLFAGKVNLAEGEAFLEKPYGIKALSEAVALLAVGQLRGRRDGLAGGLAALIPAVWN